MRLNESNVNVFYKRERKTCLTFGAKFVEASIRRFDPSSTGLVHVLVSRVLPQISAGLFDCRWQADGIPDLCSW